MRFASEYQTAAHSSSHGKDVDSEGARMDYRPDLQATLRQPQKKFNVATSNNRDQMESETSELEEVRPISGRTRMKKRMSGVAASSSDRDRDNSSQSHAVADRPGATQIMALPGLAQDAL